jgi:hypothetical protein
MGCGMRLLGVRSGNLFQPIHNDDLMGCDALRCGTQTQLPLPWIRSNPFMMLTGWVMTISGAAQNRSYRFHGYVAPDSCF